MRHILKSYHFGTIWTFDSVTPVKGQVAGTSRRSPSYARAIFVEIIGTTSLQRVHWSLLVYSVRSWLVPRAGLLHLWCEREPVRSVRGARGFKIIYMSAMMCRPATQRWNCVLSIFKVLLTLKCTYSRSRR